MLVCFLIGMPIDYSWKMESKSSEQMTVGSFTLEAVMLENSRWELVSKRVGD